MALFNGTNECSIKLGTTAIDKVLLGTTVVYENWKVVSGNPYTSSNIVKAGRVSGYDMGWNESKIKSILIATSTSSYGGDFQTCVFAWNLSEEASKKYRPKVMRYVRNSSNPEYGAEISDVVLYDQVGNTINVTLGQDIEYNQYFGNVVQIRAKFHRMNSTYVPTQRVPYLKTIQYYQRGE